MSPPSLCNQGNFPATECPDKFDLHHSNLPLSQNVRLGGLIITEGLIISGHPMAVAGFLVKGVYKPKIFSFMLSNK